MVETIHRAPGQELSNFRSHVLSLPGAKVLGSGIVRGARREVRGK